MEKQYLERELGARVKEAGGVSFKFSLSGISSSTTQMVILPGGHIGFVVIGQGESSDEKWSKQIQTLRMLGCAAARVKEVDQIDGMLCYIMSDAGRDPAWHEYLNSIAGKISDSI